MKFCVVPNRIKDPELNVSGSIIDFLTGHGLTCGLVDVFDLPDPCEEDVEKACREYDCCIVLGGDGTLLRVARFLAPFGIVVVGINLGNLGFLSAVEKTDLFRALEALVRGDFRTEDHMLLSGTVLHQDGASVGFRALNDCVITRRSSRMISLEVCVNGEKVSTYSGDGVIISTPTGSTGYNLSAGGPVVTPEAKLLVITPICPHSLNSRSIVVSNSDRITVRTDTSAKRDNGDVIMTVDGQTVYELSEGDLLSVSGSELAAGIVRLVDRSFFKVLNMKLG